MALLQLVSLISLVALLSACIHVANQTALRNTNFPPLVICAGAVILTANTLQLFLMRKGNA